MTVPNTRVCTVAGVLVAGAICAETLTGVTSEMTLDEYIEFLEPQEAQDGKPARAGAMCQSAEDWNAQKNALEQACRMLGKRCSLEIKKLLERAMAK